MSTFRQYYRHGFDEPPRKSKAAERAELEQAVQEFLRSGGQIQELSSGQAAIIHEATWDTRHNRLVGGGRVRPPGQRDRA